MRKYQIVGPKDKEFKAYHTLNYVEKLLHDFSDEELVKYNYSFSLIHRWLKIVIEARKKNICCRLNQAKKAREERDAKIQEENARLEEREAAMQQRREQHEQEHKEEIERYNEYQASLETETPMQLEEGEEPPTLPKFDEKYAIFEFDEEHPSIPIPDEKLDDKDNDWVLSGDGKEEAIADYVQSITDYFTALNAPPEVPSKKR